jgi:hypothetical protein
MNEFIIHIAQENKTKNLFGKVADYLHNQIVHSKLNNPLGYLMLLIPTLFIAFIVSKMGLTVGIVLAAVIIAIPLTFACMFYLELGISFIIILSFFLLGIKRIIGDIQIGLLMDFLVAVMIFGMIVKQTQERDWGFAKNPISKIILVWVVYNLLQAGNPSAESTMAWLYTVRSFAGIMAMYFLLAYAIKSEKFIYFLIKVWIILTLVGTAWGYVQEYAGFLPFELAWIMESPERFAILFQAGTFRKFSIFSDPLVYGILLAFTSLLCFVLATGPFSKPKKIFLILSGLFMMNGMLFSGTRAAFILPIAGLAFYGILTFKKQVLIAMIAAGMFLAVIVNIPTSNPNIVRLQTAFNPTEDASYQVRMKNQAFIRPFILTHPLGGGLGSVGEWGKQFSPWSPLANFPPDSGFVRIAVESGWVGLLIYCTLLFIVFYDGIKNYLLLKDPKLKVVSLAMLVVLFSLTLANYPQEAIGQYPINLLFFLAIAILNVSIKFDKKIIKEKSCSI